MYKLEIERNQFSAKGGGVEKVTVDADEFSLNTHSDMIEFSKGSDVVFATQQFRVVSIEKVTTTEEA